MVNKQHPNLEKIPRHGARWPWILAIVLVAAGLAAVGHFMNWLPWSASTPAPKPKPTMSASIMPSPEAPPPKVIDFNVVKKQTDENIGRIIKKRKQDFGLDKSVDMVISPDESIKVGQETIPLKDILAQIENLKPEDLPVIKPGELKPSAGQKPAPGSAEKPAPAAGQTTNVKDGQTTAAVTQADPKAPVVSAPGKTAEGDIREEDLSDSGGRVPAGSTSSTAAPSSSISVPVTKPGVTGQDAGASTSPAKPAKSGRQAASTVSAPTSANRVRKPVAFYGIYVVRQGDNLWDIHFAVLKEYLKHKGIDIAPTADEAKEGKSTGVARILKYAESMVHIFNMKTKQIDQNLDMLEPEEKVVVFNLTRLDLILGSIKPGQIDSIQYDGTDLYFPGSRTITR